MCLTAAAVGVPSCLGVRRGALPMLRLLQVLRFGAGCMPLLVAVDDGNADLHTTHSRSNTQRVAARDCSYLRTYSRSLLRRFLFSPLPLAASL